MAKVPPKVAQAVAEPMPDTSIVEQEREEFLRQFKSQLLKAHAKRPTLRNCLQVWEQYSGDPARAEVCQACYEHLQERADNFEAALHWDLKEAARVGIVAEADVHDRQKEREENGRKQVRHKWCGDLFRFSTEWRKK